MIAWVDAIETLLVAAPGNTDPAQGPLWDSVVDRLGVADTTAARERCHWDLLETEDVRESMPFFVLKQVENRWETPGMIAVPFGSIDLFYAEAAVDPDNPGEPVGEGAAHKRSMTYFGGWIDQLIMYLADQANADAIPHVTQIAELIEPQRTPRNERDRDLTNSDHWWTAYRFTCGARPR